MLFPLLLFLFSAAAASSSRSNASPTCCVLLPAAPSSNSGRPTLSTRLNTRFRTVAPSRLFFPSLRLWLIISAKSQSLPSARMAPAASLAGIHSSLRRSVGGTRLSRDLDTLTMPSSSKRVYAFFSVSLLTASK